MQNHGPKVGHPDDHPPRGPYDDFLRPSIIDHAYIVDRGSPSSLLMGSRASAEHQQQQRQQVCVATGWRSLTEPQARTMTLPDPVRTHAVGMSPVIPCQTYQLFIVIISPVSYIYTYCSVLQTDLINSAAAALMP